MRREAGQLLARVGVQTRERAGIANLSEQLAETHHRELMMRRGGNSLLEGQAREVVFASAQGKVAQTLPKHRIMLLDAHGSEQVLQR